MNRSCVGRGDDTVPACIEPNGPRQRRKDEGNVQNLAHSVAVATVERFGWEVEAYPLAVPQLIDATGQQVPLFETLAEAQRLVLFAPPGSGKTLLLKAFALQSAQALLAEQPGARCPLFLPARWFEAYADPTRLSQYLAVRLEQKEFETLVMAGRTVLIVDGLDEMVEPSRGSYYFAELLRRYPRLGLIIATRPAGFGAELSHFASFTLAPYAHSDLFALVEKLDLGDEYAARRFLDYLERSGAADLAANPHVIRLLWNITDAGSAPLVVGADLFSDALDWALRQIDPETYAAANLSTDTLLDLMGDVAVRLSVEGRHSAPIADLALDWTKGRVPNGAEFVAPTLAATGFFAVSGGDLAVTNHTLHEFLVARHCYQNVAQLMEALELGTLDTTAILRFAAELSEEVAPLVEACLARNALLNAATCLRFAKTGNEAMKSHVAVLLGARLGEDFIRLMLQQLPPDLDFAEAEAEDAIAQLHRLLDEACDASLGNHVRGTRFEAFCEALLTGPFDIVDRRYRTMHGELDLIVEAENASPYWRDFGGGIFIECKNLSIPVDAPAVHAFSSKVETAQARLGFIIATNGFTDDAGIAAQSVSLQAHRPVIVPVTGDQIRQLLQRRAPIEAFFKERVRDMLYQRKFPRK